MVILIDSYFFFNDTATTEIYTPFPTRRSSDLVAMLNRFSGVMAGLCPGHLRLAALPRLARDGTDRKSTRLKSRLANISSAVFCLQKKIITQQPLQRVWLTS